MDTEELLQIFNRYPSPTRHFSRSKCADSDAD